MVSWHISINTIFPEQSVDISKRAQRMQCEWVSKDHMQVSSIFFLPVFFTCKNNLDLVQSANSAVWRNATGHLLILL